MGGTGFRVQAVEAEENCALWGNFISWLSQIISSRTSGASEITVRTLCWMLDQSSILWGDIGGTWIFFRKLLVKL